MIHSLNIIMITAPELNIIRDALKIINFNETDSELFWDMYIVI